MDSGNTRSDFFGHLPPSLTKSSLEKALEFYNPSSLFDDEQEQEMNANNVATAAEDQPTSNPKPESEAEAAAEPEADPKVIFDKTTEKDASSPDHPHPEGLIVEKANNVATAAEDQPASNPKSESEAEAEAEVEPKMIPFDKTTEKDASPLDHAHPDGLRVKKATNVATAAEDQPASMPKPEFESEAEEEAAAEAEAEGLIVEKANNVATAAEDQPASKPKPESEAETEAEVEPKMIPFDKTTEKDASPPDHAHPDGLIEKKANNAATAAEDHPASKPKPEFEAEAEEAAEPDAEPKMIPFDKTTEKDASSPDHAHPDGLIEKKANNAATAAEDHPASKPKPEFKAEAEAAADPDIDPKMIPFDKTTEKDASSPDHAHPDGLIVKKANNGATAAEDQAASKPKPEAEAEGATEPEAEPKMIDPFGKTTEKDASSPDHPHPDGLIVKKDDGRPSWLPPEWRFETKTRQSGRSKGHVDKYYISPGGHICRSRQDFLKFVPSNSGHQNSKKRKSMETRE